MQSAQLKHFDQYFYIYMTQLLKCQHNLNELNLEIQIVPWYELEPHLLVSCMPKYQNYGQFKLKSGSIILSLTAINYQS